MAYKPSKYGHLTASDLARITRERGLEKPDVITLREWADWLEEWEKAASKATAEAVPETTASKSGVPTYDTLNAMTVKKLKAALAERGGNLSGLNTKPELIDALLASYGVSESEQAAEMDGSFEDEADED